MAETICITDEILQNLFILQHSQNQKNFLVKTQCSREPNYILKCQSGSKSRHNIAQTFASGEFASPFWFS